MIRAALVLTAAALTLAACGGGGTSGTPATTTSKACRNEQTALRKIGRDITALKRAKTEQAMSTLTDTFLLHVSTAPISNLKRNRLIDHAAAAVSITCPQCFQALEAARPIPAIRSGQISCAS